MVLEANGILVPGGFGDRGYEGKIKAIEIARKNNIPFLGICFGFQIACIEYARNVMGIPEAISEEFDSDEMKFEENHVISILRDSSKKILGGKKNNKF